MACQHSPDDQTLRPQARAGEDDTIHLPSDLDRVDFERQEEEEDLQPGYPVATLRNACRDRVSARTGEPGVSMLYVRLQV